MKKLNYKLFLYPLFLLFLFIGRAQADEYSSVLKNFSSAAQTKGYINSAYGYALIPDAGKVGFIFGAAAGSGRVYKQSVYVGDVKMKQASFGLQIGGQAFSEIIFFKDEATFNKFINTSFEFNAQASAVAINFGVSAQAGTTGNSARVGQSGGSQAAAGQYVDGMAIFTAAKGGLMLEAAVAGQSFSYTPK